MTKPERKEYDRGPRAQYFSKDDSPAITANRFTYSYMQHQFTFETGTGMFSKEGIDTGSRIMLQEFCKHEQPAAGTQLLDLGCGYGFIGIVLSATFDGICVDFVQVNGKAAKFAARNAVNNGIESAAVHAIDFMDENQQRQTLGEKRYDYILFNPPIKAGKKVIETMINLALGRLKAGGALYIVVRTSLGGKTWQATFENRDHVGLEVFKESGYRVFKLVLEPSPGLVAGKDEP